MKQLVTSRSFHLLLEMKLILILVDPIKLGIAFRNVDDTLPDPSSSPTATAPSSGGTFSNPQSPVEEITSESNLPVVNEALSRIYYMGLPSKPSLIATTRPCPYGEPTGLEAYSVPKELRKLGDHPLAAAWESGLAAQLCRALTVSNVNWTSLDALRIVENNELSGPAIVWIGVEFGALSFEEGREVALNCRKFIDEHGINDYHVEIRESRVLRQAGNRFLNPGSIFDPTFSAREPYTATLGIPISAKDRPWAEGTGGFYLSAGGDDKNIYLVTARHVILPINIDDNVEYDRKNTSQRREEVVILGTSAFNDKLGNIEYGIRGQEHVVMDYTERIVLLKGMNDPVSVKTRERAEQELRAAEEGLGALKTLRNEITTHWTRKEQRVFGELLWAPPITFSTEPNHYTLDIAIIKIDTGKLDAENYLGNTINIGDKYTRQQFMDKIYLHRSSSTSFKYPADRLVRLKGQTPESVLFEPEMLDANGDPCLVVFMNGSKSGIVFGRANNVSSFTRQYVAGQYHQSREWPIFPTDTKVGPFSVVGDSGSCVADAFSRVGGILTGGSGATSSSDISYVTPISYIMKVLHNTKGFEHAHLNPVLD